MPAKLLTSFIVLIKTKEKRLKAKGFLIAIGSKK